MKKFIFAFSMITIAWNLNGQCYGVSSISYTNDTSGVPINTVLHLSDDLWSTAIPIGFTFCFYGQQYDSLLIGTNGILTFDLDTANEYCQWAIYPVTIPSDSVTLNAIMIPWCDLDQTFFGLIYYRVEGIAPNRKFTVFYDSVPHYAGGWYTSRAILYETSNLIEVQLGAKQYSHRAIIGLQNQSGSEGVTAPGRDATSTWSSTNEAWLFIPTCNVCQGAGVNESGSTNAFSVYPNPSAGNFSLQIYNPGIASYDVIDIAGRVVLTEKVSGQQAIYFSLENPGMYFIRVYDEAHMLLKSEKIVVE